MDDLRAIRLNGDLIRRARLARNLSQRIVARNAQLLPAQLLKLERSGRCEQLTLGALFRLADALCVEPASLLEHSHEARIPKADDVAVEAALASVGRATNRDDIAWALGWDLERVNRALRALEERLQMTGQRLGAVKIGWYSLAPADDVLPHQARANLQRAAITEFGLPLRHARLLRKLANGEPIKPNQVRGRWDRLTNPVSVLVSAGLADFDGREVRLTEATAFSLCVDHVQHVPGPDPKPQARRMRAAYSADHRPRQGAD